MILYFFSSYLKKEFVQKVTIIEISLLNFNEIFKEKVILVGPRGLDRIPDTTLQKKAGSRLIYLDPGHDAGRNVLVDDHALRVLSVESE